MGWLFPLPSRACQDSKASGVCRITGTKAVDGDFNRMSCPTCVPNGNWPLWLSGMEVSPVSSQDKTLKSLGSHNFPSSYWQWCLDVTNTNPNCDTRHQHALWLGHRLTLLYHCLPASLSNSSKFPIWGLGATFTAMSLFSPGSQSWVQANRHFLATPITPLYLKLSLTV